MAAWWLAGGAVTILGGVAVGVMSRARPVDSRPGESRPSIAPRAEVAPGPRPALKDPPSLELGGPPSAVVVPLPLAAAPPLASPQAPEPATNPKHRTEQRSEQAHRPQRPERVGAGRKRTEVAPVRGPIDELDLESARAPR
jgi:hypothetical protein